MRCILLMYIMLILSLICFERTKHYRKIFIEYKNYDGMHEICIRNKFPKMKEKKIRKYFINVHLIF